VQPSTPASQMFCSVPLIPDTLAQLLRHRYGDTSGGDI
jgi:hypothetical protein